MAKEKPGEHKTKEPKRLIKARNRAEKANAERDSLQAQIKSGKSADMTKKEIEKAAGTGKQK